MNLKEKLARRIYRETKHHYERLHEVTLPGFDGLTPTNKSGFRILAKWILENFKEKN